MNSNLKKIGHWFTTNNLWHKPFNNFSQKEIKEFCHIVLNNADKTIISQCYTCGSKSFWRFKGEDRKKWTCTECHPPAVSEGLEFLHIKINNLKD